MRKLNKTEILLRWIDRHVTKIVMAITIVFLMVKVVDIDNQAHDYRMKMIDATEKYNSMQKRWSLCYVEQASALRKSTKCQLDLYDTRQWLKGCHKKLGY